MSEIAKGWREKHEEASQLLATLKQWNAEGIDDPDKAAKAHNLMADYQRLAAEAKAEKMTEEKAALEALLKAAEESEQKTGSTFTSNSSWAGPIVAKTEKSAKTETHNSFSADARLVFFEKAAKSLPGLQFKALGEGTNSAGGFLVPPQYMQDLFAETRRQGNALRRYGWLAEHPTDSNQVLLPKGSGAATVGIVAENATKPSADQAYAQVTVNIFTWAGISKISKQLAQDSSPTAADLVGRELGSLLGNLEEQKIINGSGSGEPRGILNTTGIGSVTYTSGSPTAQGIIDSIISAIANVQQNYFAPPTGILMHPRKLASIQKGKDSSTNYLFNSAGAFRAPGGLDTPIGSTSVSTGRAAVMPILLGLPIGISANVPTNLGGGTNQDAIIVGAWDEAHWFQRQDVTMDVSDTAGTAFETNQVWYRLEERAGFSAERFPSAFCAVTGTGLTDF